MAVCVHVSPESSIGGVSLIEPCVPHKLSLSCQALPAYICHLDEADAVDTQSVLWREHDTLCLRIKSRKNRPSGSEVLRRSCSCRGTLNPLCPIHVLWDKFLTFVGGQSPWQALAPSCVRHHLRSTLEKLRVPDAGRYGTHDLRRGHAKARSHHMAVYRSI